MYRPLKKYNFLYLFILGFSLIYSITYAQVTPVKKTIFTTSITYDKSNTKSINQIQHLKFKFLKNNIIPLSLERSGLWVKLTFQKKEKLANTNWAIVLKNPFVDTIKFYKKNKNKWEIKNYGFLVPKSKLPNKNYNHIILIQQNDTLQHTYYLKIKSRIVLDIPIEIISEKNYNSKLNVDLFLMGILYGILITFILYNLFLYFILKKNIYLYFSLSTLSTLIVQSFLIGHASYYLFPESPKISFYVFFTAIYLGIYFVTLFCISILDLKKDNNVYSLLKNISYLSILLIATIFIFDYKVFSIIIMLFVSYYTIALFVTGIIYWKKGNKIAKLLTIAWMFYLIGIFSNFLRSLSLIPINWITYHSNFLSYFGEVLIFSIALGYHYKQTTLEIKLRQLKFTKKLNYEVTQKTQELSDALKIKNDLLKEVHHRVKNNLQVIYSLLNLQERRVNNTESKSLLQSSKNRINSMALIHEHLYKNNSFSKINFKNYTEELISYLKNIYKRKVLIKTNILAADLPNDTAIALGLIITEIISNAFKYAFIKDDKNNVIYVNFYKKENKFILKINDNGVGFDIEEYNLLKKQTLGIQLINGMIKQINGEIKIYIDNGVNYNIIF